MPQEMFPLYPTTEPTISARSGLLEKAKDIFMSTRAGRTFSGVQESIQNDPLLSLFFPSGDTSDFASGPAVFSKRNMGPIGKKFQSIAEALKVGARGYSRGEVLNNIAPLITEDIIPHTKHVIDFLSKSPNERINSLEAKLLTTSMRSGLETAFPEEFYAKIAPNSLRNAGYLTKAKEKKAQEEIANKFIKLQNSSTAIEKSPLSTGRQIWSDPQQVGNYTTEKTYLPTQDVPFTKTFNWFRGMEKYFHPDAIMNRGADVTSKDMDIYNNVRGAFEEWYKTYAKKYLLEYGMEPPKKLNVKN